jgi:hypothetical protein
MKKAEKRLILAVSAVLMFLSGLVCAEDLPVPEGARQDKAERRLIAGSEFTLYFYSVAQPLERLKEFYRENLPALGWKENPGRADWGRIKGVKADSRIEQVARENLFFDRAEGEILIINFLPAGKDKVARFSITTGKLDLSIPPSEKSEPPFSVLLTKPEKEVAPVYPGASLVNLDQAKDFQRAIYVANQPIEQIGEYYRGNMPSYGWELKEERPLHKMERAELPAGAIEKACPSCAKNGLPLGSLPDTLVEQLVYANEKGDTCKIILSTTLFKNELQEKIEFTSIMVDYAQKKE